MAGGAKWGAARVSMGAAEDPQCQWCEVGRDNVGHLVEACPAVLPLLEWAGLTRDSIGAMPPCLRFHGVVPIGAAQPLMHKQHQLFLLAAHLYRALNQLQPKYCLDVAVPSLLSNMLATYAGKLGLRRGPAPVLARLAPS